MAKRKKLNLKRMNTLLLVGIGFIGGYISHQQIAPTPPIPLEQSDHIDVFFSPKGGCTNAIVATIDKAKEKIYDYIFAFTSKPIAAALIAAAQRGVEVRIIADRQQSKNKACQLPQLRQHNIMVWIDKVSGYSHNKVLMVDDTYLVTGSFNWSDNAENRNAENMVIIKKPALVKRYQDNWHMRVKNAIPYR